jgi:hypothetical protein
MALKKDLQIDVDVVTLIDSNTIASTAKEKKTFSNCYIKVCKVDGDKNKVEAFVMSTLTDQSSINKTYEFSPDMNGKNFIAQAYEHLKTLPEFAGAIDC